MDGVFERPIEHQDPCARFSGDSPVSTETTDWMVERSEFELSVPVSKLSDDSVVL
jgi:hypothetical protein